MPIEMVPNKVKNDVALCEKLHARKGCENILHFGMHYVYAKG